MTQISIVIPNHGRRQVLRATCLFYAKYYPQSTIHVVDSSGLSAADLELPDDVSKTIEVTQTPLTNPHSKLSVVLEKLNERLVLLASNDDLYCFSSADIVRLLKSKADCAFPRWLMIREIPAQQNILRLWEGWTHFARAASMGCSTRLTTFADQGLNAFYGLYKVSAFKEVVNWQSDLFRFLNESQWSIAENLVNLATLALSWEDTTDSWCFRKLDRKYSQNRNWRSPWIVFDELSKAPQFLNVKASLVKWIDQKVPAKFGVIDPERLLSSSVRGYQSARSRLWHSGHDFILLPHPVDTGLVGGQIFDDQRFGYLVGTNFCKVAQIAGDNSWVSFPNAVGSFQRIPSGYFFIEKTFEVMK